jgi:hypothetical protein
VPLLLQALPLGQKFRLELEPLGLVRKLAERVLQWGLDF